MQSTAYLLHRVQTSAQNSGKIAPPNPADIAKQYAIDRHHAGDFRTYVLVNSREEEQRLALKRKPAPAPDTELPKINIQQEEDEKIAGVNVSVAAQSGKKIVLTLGCQGEANAAQRRVAMLMEKVVVRLQSQGYIIACVLVLGDNVYRNGANSPDSPDLTACCEDIYTTHRTPNLAKIPFFYIQGNHDQNRHRLKVLSFKETGVDTGMNQVARSYMPSPKHKTVQDKINLYSRKLHPADEFYILNTLDCDHFNMMGLAFSLIIDDMRIFCIDSNTLVTDAMDFEKGQHNTQVEWLLRNYPRTIADGHKPILALHHPPITVCKRKYGDDLKLYMDEAYRAGKVGCYNAQVKVVLDKLQLDFYAIFAAHDHGISYYNDGKYRVVTSAGGGASVHPQLSVEENKQLAIFEDQNGIVLLESNTTDKFKLDFAIYNTETEDYPLMFNNVSTAPVRFCIKPEDKIRMEKLCLAPPEVVAAYSKPSHAGEYQKIHHLCYAARYAINEFMQVMNARPKTTKGRPDINHEEMKISHELMTYICRPYVSDFDTTLIKIADIVKLGDPYFEDTLNGRMAHAYNLFCHESMEKQLIDSMERKKLRHERPCSVM